MDIKLFYEVEFLNEVLDMLLWSPQDSKDKLISRITDTQTAIINRLDIIQSERTLC